MLIPVALLSVSCLVIQTMPRLRRSWKHYQRDFSCMLLSSCLLFNHIFPLLSRGIGISRACVWKTRHESDTSLTMAFHSDKAFLSNTAIVTMMIPVIVSWSRTLGVHPGKLLMPLSFAAARQQWRRCTSLGRPKPEMHFCDFWIYNFRAGMGLCYRLNLEDLAHWLDLPTAWWHGRVWTSHCTRWAFSICLTVVAYFHWYPLWWWPCVCHSLCHRPLLLKQPLKKPTSIARTYTQWPLLYVLEAITMALVLPWRVCSWNACQASKLLILLVMLLARAWIMRSRRMKSCTFWWMKLVLCPFGKSRAFALLMRTGSNYLNENGFYNKDSENHKILFRRNWERYDMGRLDGQYLLFREAYRVALPGHTVRMRWEHLAWSVNVVICMTLSSKYMQMSCSDQRSRCFVCHLCYWYVLVVPPICVLISR